MDGGSTCKACGALLPLPDTEGRVSCLSCGRNTKVDVPAPTPAFGESASAGPTTTTGVATATGTPTGPFTSWTPGPGQSRPTGTRAEKRSGCALFGCLTMVLLVFGGAIGSVFLVRTAVDDATESVDGLAIRSSYSPAGAVVVPLAGTDGVVVDGGGSLPVEVATSVYDGQTDRRLIARVRLGNEDTAAGVVWESEAFPANVYEAALARSGDTLFAGVADEVWALSVASGAKAWEAALPDVVQPGCGAECFAVSGDTLLVRTSDAQIVAFGPTSAEPRWTRRLEYTAGRFLLTGAGLAVIDHPPGQPGEMQVHVLDPATGVARSTFTPACHDGLTTRDFNFTDHVYSVPDSTDLVATVSFGAGCAVRWNGSTGQVAWEAPTGGDGSLDREPALVAGDRLVLASTAGLLALDLASGASTTWAVPPDLTVRPLFRHGSVLVATSTTTRGTPRSGLMGWDLSTGQIRWQTPFADGVELSEVGGSSSDALFSGRPRAVVVSDGDHLVFATLDGDARSIAVQPIDPATGALGASTISGFGDGSGIPSALVHAGDRSGLLLTLEGQILFVPSKGPLARWPS